MLNPTENPQNPGPEQIGESKRQLFEHLFPGSKFDKLPRFNPANVPNLLVKLLGDEEQEFNAVDKAMQEQQGYAKRHNLPFPDKLSVAVELRDTGITSESSFRFRGWVSDLLDQDEQLGGIGIRPVPYAPDKQTKAAIINARLAGILDPRWAEVEARLWKTASLRVIGVLDKNGKPKAVITLLEGPRPRRGIKETSKAKLLNAVPQTATG